MTFPQKMFYFIRHAQTDWNVNRSSEGYHDALNEIGIKQATAISLLIRNLPIASVCYSPLERVKQTKELILKEFENPFEQLQVPEFQELSQETWDDFDLYDQGVSSQERLKKVTTSFESTEEFMERVRRGLYKAFDMPGPVLIIAHGGTYRAICHWMGFPLHQRRISNCIPVQFDNLEGTWAFKPLIEATGLFSPTHKEILSQELL